MNNLQVELCSFTSPSRRYNGVQDTSRFYGYYFVCDRRIWSHLFSKYLAVQHLFKLHSKIVELRAAILEVLTNLSLCNCQITEVVLLKALKSQLFLFNCLLSFWLLFNSRIKRKGTSLVLDFFSLIQLNKQIQNIYCAGLSELINWSFSFKFAN